MMFLSNWLNGFGKIGRLHISTQYLSGPAVNFGQNSRLRDALRCGGAAVVRLHFDGEHYDFFFTGIDENDIARVRPVLPDQPLDTDGADGVRPPMRIQPASKPRPLLRERETHEVYALAIDTREAISPPV